MIDWNMKVTRIQREAESVATARQVDRIRRQTEVDAIVVVVGDLAFQGDETSQGRMLRRADTMDGEETVDWVLADNTVAQVTSAQLRAAARAAVDEMSRIWLDTTQGE